jgi:TRAP-type C4-dicarboxylate transport system permease small subunit
MLNSLDRILRYLYRIELWLAVSVFSAIFIINSANLLSRWFLGYAFDWILEISLIFFVYAVMLIVPVLYKDKGLIQMHLIEEVLGPKATRYSSLFVEAAVITFLLYLLPHAVKLSLSQTRLLSRGLGIPRIYVTLPVCIAAFLTLIVCLVNISHQIQALRSKAEERLEDGKSHLA